MFVKSQVHSILILISALLIAPLAVSAEPSKPPKLFTENSEMQVTLAGPWRSVKKDKAKDQLYPASLSYTGADGQQHSIEVEVAPRGLTRRVKVCDFPPLKVHFDKKKTKGTEFRGNKSLKLVTYCHTNRKYEQYYIKEFLTYRIYNLITDYSFRVRPMVIEYKDSESKASPLTRFGFLIEDLDDVAERNDMEKLSIPKISYKDLDEETISHLSLFQYMIGNLDWAATDGPKEDSCCHNAKLIGKSNEAIPKYGIPYDFDSSGLVNAHYALPPPGLKVRNIRQRLYRGFCPFNDQIPHSVKMFNEKRTEILALFETNKHLNDKSRKAALAYIEDFYKTINDPKRLSKEITGKCRGKAS